MFSQGYIFSIWRSGASVCGLKGSLQASHQWSTVPFCLPQMSQLKVSVQVNGGTPSFGGTFFMKVDYTSEGAQPAIFLSANTPRIPIFHRSNHVSLSFAQPSTGVPQTFCNSFIFQQQSSATIKPQIRVKPRFQIRGKTKFLGCIYTIDDYYGCPRFYRGPATLKSFTGERE